LRPEAKPDVIMMVCTAGHVDHGKTQLVKLLTGCETDRLKAEKERGLSIELGFAPCFLGSNRAFGIVDVPGHEKFIKNMVAGVSGIALAILVIAADDGVMPQTIEHVQIMELLGVRHGVVALTKTDLVSNDLVKTRADQIEKFLEDTPLRGSPVFPLSSVTFEGVADFYEALVDRIRNLAMQKEIGIFRMPIERAFSQKGFGVVATGLPVAGSISVGDQVEVLPGNLKGKVRGIQCFLQNAGEGSYGQCLALNIPDIRKKPARGQVVSLPGYLKAATIFHVRARTVPGLDPPLRNAEQIKLYTGTAEQPGKVYILESKRLDAGSSGLATVVVTAPVAAAPGDRFILRRPLPDSTVAGGEVLAVSYGERRPKKTVVLNQLETYERFLAGVDSSSPEGAARKIEYFLHGAQASCANAREISQGTLVPLDVVEEQLGLLSDRQAILQLGGSHFIHAEAYQDCLTKIESRIGEVSAETGSLSLTISNLKKGNDWPAPLWDRILGDLEQDDVVVVRDTTVILRDAVTKLPASDRAIIARLSHVYEETGFQSPRPDDLPGMIDAPEPEVLRLMNYLCKEGKLIRLSKNVVLSPHNFKKAQDMVVRIIKDEGSLDSAHFKTRIGSTRKYALAILDHLDARKITVRVGNLRKLSPSYERYLI